MPTAVKTEAETAAKMVAGLEKCIMCVSFVGVSLVRLVGPVHPEPADMFQKATKTLSKETVPIIDTKFHLDSMALRTCELQRCDSTRYSRNGL